MASVAFAEVVWDTELSLDFNSHGLLQQLAHGVGEEMRCEQSDFDVPVLFECDGLGVCDELISFKAPIVTNYDEGELFHGKTCMEVIWDEEPHHDLDSHGLLQQLAEGMDNQMQGKQEVPMEILCESVLCDAGPDWFSANLAKPKHGQTQKILALNWF
jgi:hypothetical protein